MQARTKHELRHLLAKKGVPEETAEEVLGRFEEVGLIDDTAFANAWVASRQQRKHLSRRALQSELQRKGVDRELVGEVLAEVTGDDEYAAALELARARAPRLAGLEPAVQRRRLQGVLARRGFASGTVLRACQAALGELSADSLDSGAAGIDEFD